MYILFVSALTAIMTSCNSQDIYYDDSNSDLDITADINNPNIDNITQKARFEAGDTIGVYMVDYLNGEPDKIGSMNYFMNEIHIFDGNYWKSPSTFLTLTDPYTLADAYAYYPYDQEMSRTWDKINLEAYPFVVQENQRNSIKNNDFLWAKYETISTSNTTIKFSFKHLLSKMIINVSSNGENIDIDSFLINNTTCNCTINMNNGKVTPSSKTVTIKPYQERTNGDYDNRLSAILIPQTIQKDSPLFLLNVDNNIYAYILEEDINLEQGNVYEFNMVVNTKDSRSRRTIGGIIYNTIKVNKVYSY